MKNRPADLPLIYLWLRQQLEPTEAAEYRHWLTGITKKAAGIGYGLRLDEALKQAAEHIAQMEDI